jgi:ComF family protein
VNPMIARKEGRAFLPRLKLGLHDVGSALMDLLFPRLCAGCGEEWQHSSGAHWCPSCLKSLPWIHSPLCSLCGRPFHEDPAAPDHLCGDCIQDPPPFDSARSATLHAGIVRDSVHGLKFGAELHCVPALAELLLHVLRGGRLESLIHLPADSILIPVPLHIKRLRQRGFNQSSLLAKLLGRALKLPVRCDILHRSRWTEPQTRLNRNERLMNLTKAFSVSLPVEVRGRPVVLVDDVFTTGTTIAECARALKGEGASEVHALTVSRSLPGWKIDSDDSVKDGPGHGQ